MNNPTPAPVQRPAANANLDESTVEFNRQDTGDDRFQKGLDFAASEDRFFQRRRQADRNDREDARIQNFMQENAAKIAALQAKKKPAPVNPPKMKPAAELAQQL